MFNLSPVVRVLVIINVVVFILQNVTSDAITNMVSLWSINTGGFRPYQFFTYMFAHGSFFHILFNMLIMASIAPILENYWGDKKFLFFYLSTGIGAGIIYTVVNYYFFPMSGGLMLGASGALYGVLMAFGMIFPNLELMLMFPPIPIKAKYLVFVMGFLTFLLDRSGNVAHLAHFGGAFVGFVIILAWRSQGPQKRW